MMEDVAVFLLFFYPRGLICLAVRVRDSARERTRENERKNERTRERENERTRERTRVKTTNSLFSLRITLSLLVGS